MIVVFQGHKPERLQNTFDKRAAGVQHFRHTVDWSRLGMKSDFNEVAL